MYSILANLLPPNASYGYTFKGYEYRRKMTLEVGMKISLIEPLGVPAETIERLAANIRAAGHEFVHFEDKASDASEQLRRAEGSEVVMIANSPLPADVIKGIDTLKMIAVAFTGIDHVGLDACRERDIMVCNCAGYSDTAVSELAVGLAIDVLRKVRQGDHAARHGSTSAGLVGREIAGKTVGIVGCGKIGATTARLFKAFGARVLGYSRHVNPDAVSAGVEFTALDTLLRQSDIVSIHLPLNEQTRRSFGASQIAAMREGSVLINCARGAIVDNDALADALASGHVAGAGIDVFDMEPPLPADYPLVQAPNLILTPHVGFLTEESMERRAKIEFANVEAFLSGTPQNVCVL